MNAKELVEEVFEGSWFTAKEAPLVGTFHPGDDNSNVIIVSGTNSSGKSMVLKIFSAILALDEIEPIQVSMRYRAGHEVSGIQRAMMFGSEDDESTGVISIAAMETAIRTANGRNKEHWILFDEPDIGLSEEYAIPMGRKIGLTAAKLPKHTQGVVIVSHSKPLIKGLLRELGYQPHFLHLASTNALNEWLNTSTERTLEELDELSASAHKKYLEIHKFLKN